MEMNKGFNLNFTKDPLEWPNQTQNYINIMTQTLKTQEKWVHSITMANMFLVIPFNFAMVIAVYKSRRLWTLGNTLLAINANVCICGSIALLPNSIPNDVPGLR